MNPAQLYLAGGGMIALDLVQAQINSYFYIGGFNCAETTFKILYQQVCVHGANDQTIKMLTGFGGGVTRGSLCGSVVAVVMALGSAYGRTSPEEPREPSKEIVNKYLDRFLARWGSLHCDQLTRGFPHKTEAQYEHCRHIIASSIGCFLEVMGEELLTK